MSFAKTPSGCQVVDLSARTLRDELVGGRFHVGDVALERPEGVAELVKGQ